MHVIRLPNQGPDAPRRIRCVTCAKQAPDVDELEAYDMRTVEPATERGQAVPVAIRDLALGFDAKLAQTGERE